jgi:hypothetical protein
MTYWVVGGEYTNTDFKQVAAGRTEEKLGPFSTFEEARKSWASRAFSTIDHCLIRYKIVED